MEVYTDLVAKTAYFALLSNNFLSNRFQPLLPMHLHFQKKLASLKFKIDNEESGLVYKANAAIDVSDSDGPVTRD